MGARFQFDTNDNAAKKSNHTRRSVSGNKRREVLRQKNVPSGHSSALDPRQEIQEIQFMNPFALAAKIFFGQTIFFPLREFAKDRGGLQKLGLLGIHGRGFYAAASSG